MRSFRRGFTLVELLVALVLIEVGLLALAGTGAMIVRAAQSGRIRAVATRTALDRLEALGARACVAASASAAGAGGIRESWVVEPLAGGMREIRDSVTFLAGGVEHSITLRTRTPC